MPDIEFQAIDGLIDYVEAFPKAAREAARIALNDVANHEGLAELRNAVEQQINFPTGYLTDDRLGVTKPATDQDLSVVITGRQRATSLARFAQGQSVASTHKSGVSVSVKRGGAAKRIGRGWLVNLRRGNADGGNLGLAIRLKPNEQIQNKRVNAVQLDDNVYLLYGPSVDQIFRDVAVDESPAVLEMVEREFFRQFIRLTK